MSARVERIAGEIANLTIGEAVELTKRLEEVFGVSRVVLTPLIDATRRLDEPLEEQTEFTLTLTGFEAARKVQVIKAVRELMPILGLKEAKEFVEALPKPVLIDASREAAEAARAKLEAAGGVATVD